jgi:hypothetical protein
MCGTHWKKRVNKEEAAGAMCVTRSGKSVTSRWRLYTLLRRSIQAQPRRLAQQERNDENGTMTTTATTISLPRQQRATQLQCSSCGAVADGACDCGAPYVPVKDRADEKIKANPEMSNRAIAAELGVGLESVRKARIRAGDHQGSPAGDIQRDGMSDAAIGRRIGKDGKSYPAQPRKPKKEPPENFQTAFFLRVDLAVTAKRECEQLFLSMKPSMLRQAADAARAVAKAWSELALSLEPLS